MNRCLGCGITLQDKDPNLVGYTPKLDNKYCMRCFKTIHYNEEIKVEIQNNQNIINKINKLNLFTIFITDFLSLNKDVIDIFKSIKSSKILVINKCDLIPSNLNLEHIKENIQNSYNINNGILFISAKQNINLNNLLNIIAINQKVILCGETSSGKSTLINNLFNTSLTTSKYNNTTLDFIKINKDDVIIYDTPGINLRKKVEDKKIKVVTKKLSNDFVLTIGDLKLKGIGNITIFVSDNIPITSKKEDIKLDHNYEIDNNSDIELDNGFILVKNKVKIMTNQNIIGRKSIISKE